jgi:nucleotidyltransferase/DNA polymerase involved in DNA repair
MIALIAIPSFAAAVARRDDPALAVQPLILTTTRSGSPVVYGACVIATRAGVRPGMTVRQAQLRCPQARCCPASPDRDARAAADMRALLSRFTPRLEAEALLPTLRVALDLGRWSTAAALRHAEAIAQMIQTEIGLLIALGLASTRTLARLAAITALPTGAAVVPPESAETLLAACRVSYLSELAAVAPRLRALGIQTLAQFAALPGAAVLAQFGATSRAVQRRLLGDDWPVPLQPEPRRLVARRQFDGPVSDRRVLVATLDILARNLATRLQAQGEQARTIQLTVQTENMTTLSALRVLEQPASTAAVLARAAGALLDELGLSSGTLEIAMTLLDLAPLRGQQLDLFRSEQGHQQELAAVLHDLVARHGRGRFFHAALSNPAARLASERVTLIPVDE